MKYINPYSKSAIVNKFADFIVSKIGQEYPSIIQVIYLGNFFVIKGVTKSDNLLDLQEIKNIFTEKYSYLLSSHGFSTLNIIDVIQYGYDLKNDVFDFEFYNSEKITLKNQVLEYISTKKLENTIETIDYNYVINKEVSVKEDFSIENTLITFNNTSISSSFPYGYNLTAGRLELFYCEYVVKQLFDVLNCENIVFRLSQIDRHSKNTKIKIMTDSIFENDKIESMVLDLFDFNLNKFQNDFLQDIELEYEIENQLTKRSWYLKDKVSQMIII